MNPVAHFANGGYFEQNTRFIYSNRTGGATVVGGFYALDVAQANAASTSINLGLTNVTATTASAIARGPIVVAAQIIADTLDGQFFGGPSTEPIRCKVLVRGNSVNIAKGDRLKVAAAANYAVKATTTDPFVAIALEAATTDDVLIEAIFNSFVTSTA